MGIIVLAEHRYRVELAVLRKAIDRLMRGELRSIALCTKDREDVEEISVLGDYRDDPGKGVAVAMKMSWRLTQLADEIEANH